jgi:hypothetical protein
MHLVHRIVRCFAGLFNADEQLLAASQAATVRPL